VRIVVTDHGGGFDAERLNDRCARIGLYSVQESIAAVGGTLEMRSTAGLCTASRLRPCRGHRLPPDASILRPPTVAAHDTTVLADVLAPRAVAGDPPGAPRCVGRSARRRSGYWVTTAFRYVPSPAFGCAVGELLSLISGRHCFAEPTHASSGTSGMVNG
jgi:hypothetical protein